MMILKIGKNKRKSTIKYSKKKYIVERMKGDRKGDDHKDKT